MPRTVLIIDDSQRVRKHVEETLRSRGVADIFLAASNGMEGLAALVKHPIDLVLCDVEMPGFDGFKFLQLKTSKAEIRAVPVIMLTGKEDVKTKVRGLTGGASDYLTKPFHEEELVARAWVHIRLKELQDELKQKNLQLEELSRTDALTGLLNRRHLLDLLAAEFEKTSRYKVPLSVVMLDVDHFKLVNDTHGHHIGDEALKGVARTLKEQLRTCDLVARYGGEEFALVLPQTDLTGALVAAERCRSAIEASPVRFESGELSVTASLGVAACPNDQAGSFERLLQLADEALYRSKRDGRNRVSAA